MIAYKGMCPGMVCLGYQLKMGLNVTEQANCQANGFHCAANPMDCLRYYGDFQNSEYYLVRPCGDLDEDAVDSRISCTQLWVRRTARRSWTKPCYVLDVLTAGSS